VARQAEEAASPRAARNRTRIDRARTDRARTDRAARAERARTGRRGPPAEHLPVARIAVDVALAHLDRLFDYLVPERLAAAAVPGCRVRVRFAGQLTGGYLLERAATSDHPGQRPSAARWPKPRAGGSRPGPATASRWGRSRGRRRGRGRVTRPGRRFSPR
jgi:hypothetical protein